MSSWIDMHTHLDKLEEGVEAALEAARAQGVRRMVTIGTDPEDLKTVLALSEKYYPEVFCTLGIHPHEGGLYTDEVGQFIRTHLNKKEVIAVGEIGLDYFYQHASREHQIHAFHEQLKIADEFQMPVEIHTRDAEEDTVKILQQYPRVKGIIHCFTGTQWLADQCLELGYNISISGVVTFKNADPLRKIVQSIPLDRIHVETDAPFLAPVPKRGAKNTPAFVVHTAEVVAGLKNISMQQLADVTRENAERMFPKMKV